MNKAPMPTRAGDVVISHGDDHAFRFCVWHVETDLQQTRRSSRCIATALGHPAALTVARLIMQEHSSVFEVEQDGVTWTKHPRAGFAAGSVRSTPASDAASAG